MVKLMFEKHRLNISSYAPLLLSPIFSDLESNVREFSTSNNKLLTVMNLVKAIAKGHQMFVHENCKDRCRAKRSAPFCTTWEITFEKSYEGATFQDRVNGSQSDEHDLL